MTWEAKEAPISTWGSLSHGSLWLRLWSPFLASEAPDTPGCPVPWLCHLPYPFQPISGSSVPQTSRGGQIRAPCPLLHFPRSGAKQDMAGESRASHVWGFPSQALVVCERRMFTGSWERSKGRGKVNQSGGHTPSVLQVAEPSGEENTGRGFKTEERHFHPGPGDFLKK